MKSPRKNGHPTILVAVNDAELRRTLVDDLCRYGYLVLDAADAGAALHAVRKHSRTIHLMLIHTDLKKELVDSALRRYRPDMRLLFVARYNDKRFPDVMTPEDALANVQAFFEKSSGEPKVREQAAGRQG
jgi:CheY-like chemotaxis protein